LVETSGEFAQPLSPKRFDRRWITLGVTTIGSFMSILDATVVNIALPSILRDFHANLDSGQLVLTVYLLALAIVIPAIGFLADRIGMKRLYMLTLAGFTASSALCGLSWNLPSLIGFRATQGLAGGMLQPLGIAIVFTIITPLERGRFMVMLGLPQLLAPILGPTVGGYIVQYFSWRLIFFINLPLGLINLFLARKLLKETEVRPEARLDLRGFILAALAFPGIILGLSEGSERGWSSPIVLVLLVVGVLALIAFIRVELKVPEPLLHLRLFSDPTFSLAMVILFIANISLFGVQYLLPLFLQQAHGIGAAKTGLVLFPSGIASFLAMNIGGRLYNRVGPRPLAITGLVTMLLGTLALSRINASSSLLLISGLASIRGIALGLCFIPVQTAAYNTVVQKEMAHATALTQVFFRIYGSASTAILTTLLIVALALHGAPKGASITGGTVPLGELVKSFSDAFIFMSVLALVGVFLSLFLHDRVIEKARGRPLLEPVPLEAAGE
jgi:EmrB/QacA subfamily drug resistance transporter